MTQLQDRAHSMYTDIERFHAYELTECVAWEMAIRNKDVKSLLAKLDDIRNIIFENYAYRCSDNIIIDKQKSKIDDICMSVDVLNYVEDEKIYFRNEKKKLEELEKNVQLNEALGLYYRSDIDILNSLLGDFEREYRKVTEDTRHSYTTKTFLFSHKKLPEFIKLSNEFFSYYKKLKDDYYVLYDDYINLDNQEKNVISNPKSSSWKFKKNNLQPYKITTKLNQEIDSSLLPEKSRPRLTAPIEVSSTLALNINLNLPLKEITEYIKQLKDVYTLDEKLIKPNILKRMCLSIPVEEISYITEKGVEKNMKLSTIFLNKKKLGNVFYIYDCRQNGIDFPKIQTSLFHYGNTSSDIDDTLKLYFEIAKYYIDSLHYKELITGYTP